MDSKILQLMESADPQDRKKAVKMLAQIGGPEAIRALGTIYKQDSDPEVKELAIQAGKYIKKQEAQATSAPAPQPTYRAPVVEEEEDDEEVEEQEEEFQPVVVPAGKQEQAKGLMDRALDLSMHGEREKAVESLAKAFKLNPNLRLDSYYMGVAMDITGLDKKGTLDLVTIDEKARKAKNKEKAKNDGTGDSGNEEVTWDTALIDLTLYYVVIAGVAIIGMVMFVQAITTGFAAMASCKNCSPAEIQTMQQAVQIFRSLNGLGIAASVLYGLIVALINIVALLIYFVILHFFAKFVFGGDGSLAGLIHRASLPLIVTYAVTGVISLITAYLTIKDLFNPEAMRQMASMTSTMAASTPSNPLVSLLGPISSLVGILGSIWFIGRIAQNYEFSWMRGCLADLLTNIAIFAMACGCWMLVLSSLVNSLSSMPRMTPLP